MRLRAESRPRHGWRGSFQEDGRYVKQITGSAFHPSIPVHSRLLDCPAHCGPLNVKQQGLGGSGENGSVEHLFQRYQVTGRPRRRSPDRQRLVAGGRTGCPTSSTSAGHNFRDLRCRRTRRERTPYWPRHDHIEPDHVLRRVDLHSETVRLVRRSRSGICIAGMHRTIVVLSGQHFVIVPTVGTVAMPARWRFGTGQLWAIKSIPRPGRPTADSQKDQVSWSRSYT